LNATICLGEGPKKRGGRKTLDVTSRRRGGGRVHKKGGGGQKAVPGLPKTKRDCNVQSRINTFGGRKKIGGGFVKSANNPDLSTKKNNQPL